MFMESREKIRMVELRQQQHGGISPGSKYVVPFRDHPPPPRLVRESADKGKSVCGLRLEGTFFN